MNVGERETVEGQSPIGAAKEVGSDLAELVRAEIALARQELAEDVHELRGVAWTLGLAAGATFVGVELVLGALVAAGRRHPFSLAMLGFGLIGAGLALGAEARRAAPTVLQRTRWRVVEDARLIEEGLR